MGLRKTLRKWSAKLAGKGAASGQYRPSATPLGEWSPVAFYDEKNQDAPRFIYRRLAHDLTKESDAAQRASRIETFLARVEKEGAKGDFQKFKWNAPSYLRDALSPQEYERIETAFAERRRRRNRRLIEVYPHCADEFSLGSTFFDSVLNVEGEPLIGKNTPVFTLGSCFARNIAVFLKSQGYNARAFPMAEDLNSPLSNAKMLSVAIADDATQDKYISFWLSRLQPDETVAALRKLVEREKQRLKDLAHDLRSAKVIIVTIGNIFDFFLNDQDNDIASDVPVAPKFFRIWESEDVGTRGSVSQNLKAAGAKFRMASFSETRASLDRLREAVRAINPEAHCILTLSPVPFDSAVGLEKTMAYGSIELDCVSKAMLRAALHEFYSARAFNDPKLLYFPSFEIVRWIGAMSPVPIFGAEDAASRHVSAQILNAVYGYFLLKFGTEHKPA